jgi:hypothetical protein
MTAKFNVSRREFLKYAFISGAVTLVHPNLISSDSGTVKGDIGRDAQLNNDHILVKNPAYRKVSSSGKLYLLTTKANGEQLAFKIDSDAEYLWDRIGDVWEYEKNKKTSFGQLMKELTDHFSDRKQEDVKIEATAFLSKALKCGIVAKENNAQSIFADKEKNKK